MPYTVGDLLVSINGSAQGASKSINTVIRHLNSLKTAIIQLSGLETSASSKIVSFFTDIAKGVKNIDSTAINTLGASIKSLTSISNLTKLEKLDYSKVASGFGKLTTAITPFIDKVKEAGTSLDSLYGILQKSSGKKLQNLGIGGDTKNAANNINKLFNLGKITAFYRVARRVGSTVADIVQYGVNYTETLNLWTVAMRDNLTQAEQFVNKMNRAYGISERTLMDSQAIFKNMLGSLGQVSGDVAYALSEAMVQMSADFASLYNVSFESALTKMQAMLAGQVRPIRSAGLDITETTLFQFYQEMGGTKTRRQLTRTEKQLLSIYAVFQQMGKAGALGDMQKTLNQFANQSRMVNENFHTMLTWAGVIGKAWIENTGILVYVNALLITMGDILKAIAGSMGAIDSEDFLDKIFETAEDTNGAIDELQGKLLDFDKFRALNGAEGNAFGIDEKLLKAITGYSSVINESANRARQIADEWLKILGITRDENGELSVSDDRLKKIKNTLMVIGVAIGIIAGFAIVASIGRIVKSIFTLNNALTLLNGVLVVGAIAAIIKAVQAFKDGEIGAGLLATAIGIGLVGAFIALNWEMIKTTGIKIAKFFSDLTSAIKNTSASVKQLSAFVIAASLSFTAFNNILGGLSDEAKRVVAPIFIVVGALTTLLGVILAIREGTKYGLIGAALAGAGLGALMAGIKATAESYSVPKYANGASDIDSGTMFIAGEAGRTEAVYSGNNGKTNVSNVSQMQQAFYNALVQYGKENRGGSTPIQISISGKPVFTAVRAEANKAGLDFSRK